MSGKETRKVVAIVQARYGSRRFPGKVMKLILGQPMLALQIARVKRAVSIDQVVIATSTNLEDDCIAAISLPDVAVFRGAGLDVLDRYYRCAVQFGATDVVRLSADCPLIDPQIIDQVVALYFDGKFDYASNAINSNFPDGLDVEVLSASALESAFNEARLPSEREHVTRYINQRPERFRIGIMRGPTDLSMHRWTVDTPQDFSLVEAVYQGLLESNSNFSTDDILAFLRDNPSITALNYKDQRNEGLEVALLADRLLHRYQRSRAALERARRVIPLASQTFSKSTTQFPESSSPLFIDRALGARAWDVDGNEYIDFVNSLAAVNIGHCDARIMDAVSKQLRRGTLFSLPAELEAEVAEKIVELVPGAEMVRFGKNGSDATTGAVRLARAATGRWRILCCGYHGWHDWYIGTTSRAEGVPPSIRELTTRVDYNDIDGIERKFAESPHEIAAVIMEPMTFVEPRPGFLQSIKELCHLNGALLIFDETITGFRLARGGAQELFGVVPDLSTFGKGLANGFPVSCVVGPRDLMKRFEDVFFSFTFGGETLSLAAASETLNYIKNDDVIPHLYRIGTRLKAGFQDLLDRAELSSVVRLVGNPTWTLIEFLPCFGQAIWSMKTFFLQEIFRRGILTIGTHNLSFAHTDADIDALIAIYSEVLPRMKELAAANKIESNIVGEPLRPLFSVR